MSAILGLITDWMPPFQLNFAAMFTSLRLAGLGLLVVLLRRATEWQSGW